MIDQPEHDAPGAASRLFTRRNLLYVGSAAAVAAAFELRNGLFTVDAKTSTAKEVKIVEFSDAGERKDVTTLPVIVKSDAEWKQLLSPDAFEVTRHAATERAFSGQYWNNHEKGLYRCICCATALFKSDTKFESGTGWPSFFQPIAKENVREDSDFSLGMQRIAVNCRLCEAHLGHVFDDGPPPTGLRYCMNSLSLHFVKFA
jgi:peptide-methionine (R)-S-oxide reductase